MMQCVIVALSYALLAEEACRGSRVGLPRTALLQHYPCGATTLQRLSYIAPRLPYVLYDCLRVGHPDTWVLVGNTLILLQLPAALLLPTKWFHRTACLLSYCTRLGPLIAHAVTYVANGPTAVPGVAGRWYIMNALWSCELFNFLAIPVGAGSTRQNTLRTPSEKAKPRTNSQVLMHARNNHRTASNSLQPRVLAQVCRGADPVGVLTSVCLCMAVPRVCVQQRRPPR